MAQTSCPQLPWLTGGVQSSPRFVPNRFRQNRTVACVMSIQRSWSRCSTVRSESGKRIYIITARRMTSGEVLKNLNGLRIGGG